MSCAGWKRKKIGELFDVQLGKMLNEKAKQGEQYPYLANFNVRWGSFDLSKLNKMYFSEKEKKKFSLRCGDLLMCEGGEIGRCAVWNKTNQSIYYQKALHRLRPLNHDIESLFVYYFMEHIASKGELSKIVGESSIAHLTREKLLHLLVPTPPCNEQKMIVRNLSTWDQAIEKAERLIAVKEKRFTWLLNKLINEGNDNRDWRKVQLGDLAVIQKGQQLNVDDMIDAGKYYALNGGMEPSGFTNNWNTHENTITISEGGNSCGFVNFNIQKFWCGGHCYVLNNVHSDVEKKYLYFFLKLHEQLLMSLRVGSGLPNIQKKDLQKFPVLFPSLIDQKKIAGILDNVWQEIDILKKQLEAYRKQKRGLMQKLLTGQWRVKINTDDD